MGGDLYKNPIGKPTIAQLEMILKENEEKEKLATELIIANKELAFQNKEKDKRAAELIIANKELAFQNEEKEKRAAELIIANKELAFQNKEKEKRAAELIIANKELAFQNKEKDKRAAELIIANKELAFQNEEKEKRAAELVIADKELDFQNEEKEKRAAELVLADKELDFQNEEKEKRAAELVLADKELDFQNEEKEKRAAELVLADKELDFQNEEKDKRAAELIIANKELAFQNEEKEKRAAELVLADKELDFQNEENEKIKELNTQLESLNKALEASNEELGRFAYSVSHDLRAPLRHISGFIEMLNSSLPTPIDEKSQHYLQVIHDAAKDMGNLIDGLLSYSRIGRTELVKRRVDPGEIIKNTIVSFKPEIKGRSITWAIGKLPTIEGDSILLQMVFANLISNAIKFTRLKETANITIGSAPDPENDDQIIFYIKDNGVGFDMRYQEKLFGVFQRLHTQKDFEGVGIGLANVKHIVIRHGGRVWSESELDKGATFYFTLPKYKEG